MELTMAHHPDVPYFRYHYNDVHYPQLDFVVENQVDDFMREHGVNLEYSPAEEVTPGVFNPPVNTFYTAIRTPLSEDAMRYVIGKGGVVFKTITFKAMVDYIWYNKEHSLVEIYGPEDNLDYAADLIMDRIELIASQRQ
jgi:hypothetical protein